jgi:dihydrofolate reductase
MPRVTADMTITLDGYGSGRGQSAEHPFGDLDADRLHAWQFDHRGENSDETNAITTAGAYIMGRNMFGPDRGEWDLDAGGGERVFEGVGDIKLRPVTSRATPYVTHLVYRR